MTVPVDGGDRHRLLEGEPVGFVLDCIDVHIADLGGAGVLSIGTDGISCKREDVDSAAADD